MTIFFKPFTQQEIKNMALIGDLQSQLAAVTAERDALKAEAAKFEAAYGLPPQSMVLVPREPTPEMILAYLNANDDYWNRTDKPPTTLGKWRNGTPSEATAAGYRAMIAAAEAK